jgi:hypothetical protein
VQSYLQRYLAGDHEAVWADLLSLGAQVRAEPLYTDALAVARETMRRVRENLERLIPRLVAAGYQFGYGWVQPPADEPFGWRLRQEHLRMLESAVTQPPILIIESDVEELLAERQGRLERLRNLGAPAIILANEEREIAELEAHPRATTELRELEERVGMLPLSVRAWYEVVGGVNLVGVHPGWMQFFASTGEIGGGSWEHEFALGEGGHPMQVLEPLQVYPLGSQAPSAGVALKTLQTPSGSQRLLLVPNSNLAYLGDGQTSYMYEIEVPCARVDAPLLFERHETTFVDYLRVSLRWAGFPGWERIAVRPDRDIATLIEGLLPF